MSLGVIVGCDRKQEWLLEWWWSHYSKYNSLPVAFMDLGMSKKGIQWCRSHGMYVPVSFDGFKELPLDESKREMWTNRLGEEGLSIRSVWMKKPFAFLHSPFEYACWLDLDCEVRCLIDPLLSILFFGFDLAMVPDLPAISFSQEKKMIYNSGVVVFRRDAKIIREWVRVNCEQNNQFIGDQDQLTWLIHEMDPPLFELDQIFNAIYWTKFAQNGKIIHYTGEGKLEIFKTLQSYRKTNF